IKRIEAIGSSDPGNYRKGVLAGWGIDMRDPTDDVRLIEFCLSVPTEQFCLGGVPRSLARRAMASRLPAVVLDERRKGLQAADWYERLTVKRSHLSQEVRLLQQCASARRILDLPRMQRLLADWPLSGWESMDTIWQYRYALLRGISAGHFLRRAGDG